MLTVKTKTSLQSPLKWGLKLANLPSDSSSTSIKYLHNTIQEIGIGLIVNVNEPLQMSSI